MADVLGKVLKTLVRGGREPDEAKPDLKSRVDEYNRTLSNIHSRVSFKTHTLVENGINSQKSVSNFQLQMH